MYGFDISWTITTCLPVAEVEIECDLGTVTSKAAVIGNHLDQGRYILGNQAAALLQGIEENCSSDVGKVNTAVICSQTRQSKENEIFNESDQIDEQTELNLEEGTDNLENEEILPPVDGYSPINPVTQIKLSTFIAEQEESKELAPIIELVKKGNEADYGIKNGILGDAVLVLTLNQPHKLAPQWKGPGMIEKRLSETNYVVTFDGDQEGNKVYHINMLKPYHKRPELLNVVLVDTKEITEPSELEEDFPYMLTDPNVFDFREIVENNKLKERLGAEQIM
ncbi:retrovirus-related Pol polyprotein from transposon 297 [Trichonephila inaurata madagascariensis]|uniref:Retrovirus-related Pol polyprotein from transposon 297 n=1 Tax=Trichonephila inaurata madagascariensis TaxID=2747483 RepID=A0A8X6X829_9ARAC|nr:retrovirus-related Pol polyprotein from transposon 297 [Trichonephila inaurata madagascariensis]